MAKIPYYVRHLKTNTIDATDSIVVDVLGSDVPKIVPFSAFSVSSSTAPPPYVEKTANYTATSSDYTINCTANTFTVTLPTAVGITGRCYEITNTGSGVITLEGDGTETIQGDLTQTIYQDESFTLRSNGSNWIVIG